MSGSSLAGAAEVEPSPVETIWIDTAELDASSAGAADVSAGAADVSAGAACESAGAADRASRVVGPSAVRAAGSWLALGIAGGLAVLAGAGLLVAGLAGPSVVTPTFAGGDAVATDWGDAELFGAVGSWVLGYDDGGTISMSVPWTGGDVETARLGDGPVDLATVVATSVVDDRLVATIAFDGCDFFHEREMQIHPALTVVTTGGDEAELRFDRPLFVRSPMLWECPDRLVDRYARNRSDL